MSTDIITNAQMDKLREKEVAQVWQVMDDIKAKNWETNFEWMGVLSVAPACIQLLAMCAAVAARPEASGLELYHNPDFQYLRKNDSLQGALVQVGNVGRTAFGNAFEHMENIHQKSSAVEDSVYAIFEALSNQNTNVGVELRTLTKLSENCLKSAEGMLKDFVNWEGIVKDLHQACEDRDQGATRAILENEKEAIMNKARREHYEREEARMKLELESKKEEVAELKESLDRELRDFPRGMELAKMDIFKSLADSVTGLFTALGNIGSAVAMVKSGGAFANAANGILDSANPLKQNTAGKGSKNTDDKDDTDDEDDTKAKSSVGDDKAHLQAGLIRKALEQLEGLLKGDDKDGIQWNLVTGVGDSEKAAARDGRQWDLVIVNKMLNMNSEILKKSSDKKNSKTGKKLLSAIDTVDPVLDDLEKLAKTAKTVGKDWEQPTEKQIKKWLDVVEEGLATVQEIEVARKGSKQVSRPAMSPVNLALASPPAVAGQSVSQHVVSAHRFLVETAREGHTTAKIALDQMKKDLVELQSNVSEITAKGQNLAGAKLTLKDIKEVLNDCIDYVITLKDHITRMLIFFRTFKTRVDTVMMSQIEPFTGRVENIINNHKLMFDLILLQTNAIQIWASFEQFKDIAKMYKDIYNPHLVDGLHLVDLMTRLPKGSDFASQLNKIEDWKKGIQGQVDQIVEKQIFEVKRKLNEEEKELLESRFKFPDPPKRQQLAIQQGTDEARKEINSRIEDVNPELKYMGKTHQDQSIEELKKDIVQLKSPNEYVASMRRPRRN
ncbi:putative zgc:162509 protein [Botrytis fragariae]|uniref:Putative zgc:162509 protein n=1 Tax=Botrytis fragariae TaxID=1964551 RepID=A0A8H6EE73_9HELO|nr:putative zgc:162509 protein [Botrytis fragariae]KAF5869027.1 putative zgc:162509 protein [Botrytis fragariae]